MSQPSVAATLPLASMFERAARLMREHADLRAFVRHVRDTTRSTATKKYATALLERTADAREAP